MDEIHIVSETLDGDRFDRCLATVGEMSRGLARQLIDTEQATLNAKLRPSKTKVRVGDVVAFTRPPEREALQPNSDVAFDVLYEDADVAVINKPVGLVVHPGHGHRVDTLAAGLLARWPNIRGVGEDERWGIVHRLDRDTSGVLCVALSREAHTSLTRALARREVKRSYLTLVHGLFDMTRGTIDAPIGKDAPATLRMMVTRDGKPARTHYRRIESMEAAEVSLVEVELETGRTHQIRVHMASIDHPVVGDNLYCPFVDTVEVDRIFLHAAALAFTHPISGELVEVSAELPTDLASVLQRLRSAES